jgi:hypothetical protein
MLAAACAVGVAACFAAPIGGELKWLLQNLQMFHLTASRLNHKLFRLLCPLSLCQEWR